MRTPSESVQSGGGATLVWFRRDLRLRDNPALWFAVERGRKTIPVFIYSPEEEGTSADGYAGRWWLKRSLEALAAAFEKKGTKLIFRRGPAEETLLRLLEETGADAVYWNRNYDPDLVRRDTSVKKRLRAKGCEVKSFNGNFLFDPVGTRNLQGNPYRVFTPFWNHCLEQEVEKPFPAPKLPTGTGEVISSLSVEELELGEGERREECFGRYWEPGEEGAQKRFRAFLQESLPAYLEGRDFPARADVSRLSPHLHFGEIGVREIWAECRLWAADDKTGAHKREAEGFLRQLGWREFSCHVIFHFPETVESPLRQEFERFPWSGSAEEIGRWQEGRTGYPIVDAGMRELWETGWMHNRVRMIVASFLVKHLLVSWTAGARWFQENLVDADVANNTMGWQWSAGCGADPAPYFRIFNPTLQGKKFDSEGEYVGRWVPELKRLPAKWIHEPAAAPAGVLAEAGVVLGGNYPRPMVDHRKAREKALAAFQKIRQVSRDSGD